MMAASGGRIRAAAILLVMCCAIGQSDALSAHNLGRRGADTALRRLWPCASRINTIRGGEGDVSLEEDTMAVETDVQILQEIRETREPGLTAVEFKWPDKGQDSIKVSGSWDNWQTKSKLQKNGKHFSAILNLPTGKHHFKYLVNGKWTCDEKRETERDNGGNKNNVIYILKESDKVVAASGGGVKQLVFEIVRTVFKIGAGVVSLLAGVYGLKTFYPDLPVDLPGLAPGQAPRRR